MDRTEPTCGDCAHAHLHDASNLAARLCWRYPPQVFPMQAPGGVLAGVSLRPQVKASDPACQEFKPKG